MAEAKKVEDLKTEENDAGDASMEDILSSIRQIISDDGTEKAGAKPAAAAEEADEVLELTEDMLVEEPQEAEPSAKAEPEVIEAEIVEVPQAETMEMAEEEQMDDFAMKETPEVTSEELSSDDLDSLVENMVQDMDTPQKEEPLLSNKAATTAKNSFADLNKVLSTLGNSENTLEGLVKEILRPMLKDWLDQNLPRVVDKLVRKEIEKLTQ